MREKDLTSALRDSLGCEKVMKGFLSVSSYCDAMKIVVVSFPVCS